MSHYTLVQCGCGKLPVYVDGPRCGLGATTEVTTVSHQGGRTNTSAAGAAFVTKTTGKTLGKAHHCESFSKHHKDTFGSNTTMVERMLKQSMQSFGAFSGL